MQPFLVLLLSTATLAAQTYTVSPATYADRRGVGSNVPFAFAANRYQQIHGDLRGTPRLIYGMALRRSRDDQPGAVARRIDVTVLMADSSWSGASTTFASNYVGTPVMMLPPRTRLQLPDWTVAQRNPEPWTLVVPFAWPFGFYGVHDLLWEWRIHGTDNSSPYSADAYYGLVEDTVTASIRDLGTGCTPSGLWRPMTQSIQLYSMASRGRLYALLRTLPVPANMPAAIWFGTSNPDLTLPGLCTKLFVLPTWSLAITSSTVGAIDLPPTWIDYDAAWAGVKLYSQTIVVDAGRPIVPLSLSQGQEATLPGFGSSTRIQRIWAVSDVAVTGAIENYPFGLITRFAH